MGKFVDYINLTYEQQTEVRSIRPKWTPEDFLRMSFWVKPTGKISRRAGHHQITKVEGAKIDSALKEALDRTSDMSRKWKSATFHFAPER